MISRTSQSILFLLLVLLLDPYSGKAQQELFDLPSTICTNMRIDLSSKIKNQDDYYWHFCAGDLTRDPVVSNITSPSSVLSPSHTKLLRQGKQFFSFHVNGNGDLIRTDFDKNMDLTSSTNLGDLNGIMPTIATSIDVFQNPSTGDWFGLIVGFDPIDDEGSLVRIEFGASLINNSPVSVNFGKYQNMLRPMDINVVIENSNILAYTINDFDNTLGRVDFGSSVFNNPSVTNLGANFGIVNPSGMVAFEEGGTKYIMAVNAPGGFTLINFGAHWTNSPNGSFLGSYGGRANSPIDITTTVDCGTRYFIIKNRNNLLSYTFTYTGSFTNMQPRIWAPLGHSATPRSLSELYRVDGRVKYLEMDMSNMFQGTFENCNNSFYFREDFTQDPDWVKYYTAGFYTIYLRINEGKPDENVYCHTFEVIDGPVITATSDTLICQRDTAKISAVAGGAISYLWEPDYNISSTTLTDVSVYPDSTTGYTCFIQMANGCLVDTTIDIEVSRVTADAGPDQTVYDGSSVVLGGPGTSESDGVFSYSWYPSDECLTPTQPYTEIQPESSRDFVLTVTNGTGCDHSDTARITVICDDIRLPNAFSPLSGNRDRNRFGLINRALYSLNYFRIYNRYGNLIFEAQDQDDTWDGTYEGELQPQDNYVYEVDAVCEDGYILHKTGTVLLLR